MRRRGFSVIFFSITLIVGVPAIDADTKIKRNGSKLHWGSKELKLIGYSSIDLITKSALQVNVPNYLDTSEYMRKPKKIRHGVNLQRVWATGFSNVFTPCSNARMPFAQIQDCTNGPVYDLCIESVNGCTAIGLDQIWMDRLDTVLQEAKTNGQIVQLTFFDAVTLSKDSGGSPAYLHTPWNPLHNNMHQGQLNCTQQNGGLPLDTNGSQDAFPEFYRIKNTDGTLNCLGLIQKAFVQKIVQYIWDNDFEHVFFEIMNEARRGPGQPDSVFDEIASWHNTVGGWIKNLPDGTKTNFLVSASVIGGSSKLNECTGICAGNPFRVFTQSNIDIVDLHWITWMGSNQLGDPCDAAATAISKFNKPVIINTDGAPRSGGADRDDNCIVKNWADTLFGCQSTSSVHFNHMDGTLFNGCTTEDLCFDCDYMDRLGDLAPKKICKGTSCEFISTFCGTPFPSQSCSQQTVLSIDAVPSKSLVEANGELIPVEIQVEVTKALHSPVIIELVSITSNEAHFAEDIMSADYGTDDRLFWIKAKRSSANSEGRVYLITYKATDKLGNVAYSKASVTVE